MNSWRSRRPTYGSSADLRPTATTTWTRSSARRSPPSGASTSPLPVEADTRRGPESGLHRQLLRHDRHRKRRHIEIRRDELGAGRETHLKFGAAWNARSRGSVTTFRDQSCRDGHHDRIDDLDRIAALGIRTLRYPVLWETISPDSPDRPISRGTTSVCRGLQNLDIRPIAGLCHHGSGPRYTNMLDPAWPDLLARHAAHVAERYPHLELYTPVNEPLTTARFCGLYGHWYPHGTELRGRSRRACQPVQGDGLRHAGDPQVAPGAQLVQTDDMGKTFSTPALAYQAEHENQRRWLGFDLLCGMVDRAPSLVGHPHRATASTQPIWNSSSKRDAAPDIIGINHYLDQRALSRRAPAALSRSIIGAATGNIAMPMPKPSACRLPAGTSGLLARLREVWERYRRPIAVTEAHHGCTRDEQLRWLMEVWKAAQRSARKARISAPSRSGRCSATVDWNCLLTRPQRLLRAGTFRCARARTTRQHRAGRAASEPAKTSFRPPGARPGRLVEAGHPLLPCARKGRTSAGLGGPPRQLLITGATGTLGRAFSRICDFRGLNHVLRPAPTWISATARASRQRWPATSPGRSSTPPAMCGSRTPKVIRSAASVRTPRVPEYSRRPAPISTFRS